jgi:hypothetical protein
MSWYDLRAYFRASCIACKLLENLTTQSCHGRRRGFASGRTGNGGLEGCWQQPASVYYLINRQRECILPFSLKNWPRAAQLGPGSRSTVGFRIITTTLEVQFFPARERSLAFQKARRNVVS